MVFLMSTKNIIVTSIVVTIAVAYVLGYIGMFIYKLIRHISLEACECQKSSKSKKMFKNIINCFSIICKYFNHNWLW